MGVARRTINGDVEVYYISEDLKWFVVRESIQRTAIHKADTVPAFVLGELFKL